MPQQGRSILSGFLGGALVVGGIWLITVGMQETTPKTPVYTWSPIHTYDEKVWEEFQREEDSRALREIRDDLDRIRISAWAH